jgi:GNAT superfamily N-acetyltransferase
MTTPQSLATFPTGDSPSLSLTHPTPAERLATWSLNAKVWAGPLSSDAYTQREEHLSQQDLTRDGGITFWILVDNSAPPFPVRRILASCETIKKRALIARGDGCVAEVISYGVQSVFCDPDLRGRGYAGRMMEELGSKLDTWGRDGMNKTAFTVLYSDIGKV